MQNLDTGYRSPRSLHVEGTKSRFGCLRMLVHLPVQGNYITLLKATNPPSGFTSFQRSSSELNRSSRQNVRLIFRLTITQRQEVVELKALRARLSAVSPCMALKDPHDVDGNAALM